MRVFRLRLLPPCLVALMSLQAVADPDTLPPLLATLELDRPRAHVDEQVLLTLSVGVPSIAFAVTADALAVDGAELVSLERHEELRTVDDVSYRFTLTTYALFADRAGTLEVPALGFRATLPVSAGGPGSARNPRVSASTEPRRIPVEVAPESPGEWLPARGVTLSSDRARSDRAVRAGEPFTRHVRVDALGQRPSAIPPLASMSIDGLRSYPEPARLDTRLEADGLYGSRTESTVIVATAAGSVTLPEVTLDWWDIDTRRWRTATLPAESIVVEAGTVAVPYLSPEHRRYRLALAAALTLCALLATSTLLLWRRGRTVAGATITRAATRGPATERDAWTALRRALRRGDARSIRGALERWRRSRRGDDAPALATASRELEERLYRSDTPNAPELRALGKALIQARGAESSWRARWQARRLARAPRDAAVRLYPTGGRRTDEREDEKIPRPLP